DRKRFGDVHHSDRAPSATIALRLERRVMTAPRSLTITRRAALGAGVALTAAACGSDGGANTDPDTLMVTGNSIAGGKNAESAEWRSEERRVGKEWRAG